MDHFAAELLTWYDRHHRELPWRVGPADKRSGERPDPYHVWLSEIMLQQTTVQAVKAYYEKFLARWPRVENLAAAATDEVMAAWAGLGYYARARNLKKCAETVAAEHGGKFPDTFDGLKALPGIGDYTAAAIAAIAFDRPEAVVDGNVERVVTRLFAIDTPLPAAKPVVRDRTASMTPEGRPGDFAQAMMDLGATICTPRRPTCALCPFRAECAALAKDDPERFPVKLPKAARPVRRGAAFVAETPDGRLLLRTRKASGLLGGMAEVPTTGWTSRSDGETDAEAAPFVARWAFRGEIVHVFTHFELRLSVWHTVASESRVDGGRWAPLTTLGEEALPSVMKKAISQAIPDAFKALRK
ncbi:A/G-specific adenine glycosylase [Martelella endophytica]|uniref:Adenine DNA glycosylase n=1 Tax=Martelella endophytica TaxID=1486262 RepID=A0A0D5LW15_MAREN|nr:A/G-specific adenine glycosylase [Martelella endophytica]AJY47583.1 adenine glycosylase [Martelella endophytica]